MTDWRTGTVWDPVDRRNDKPHCPICDGFHYKLEPHEFYFPNKQVEANYRWREKNKAKYNKDQKLLMRKRRSEGKA